MAYIGKTPVLGNFVKLDAITVVNGQAAYTMQNGGVNFTDYTTVNQFLVSLNGTIQSPTDSFTVSGSTLTFASNLATGDVIDFIMVFGNSLSAGTPTDATVTTVKLADSSVTTAKLADSSVTTAKLNDASVSLAKLTATGTKDATTFLRGDNTFGVPPLGGITEADQWRLTANTSSAFNGDLTTNWERNDSTGATYIGTGLSQSSGIFSFPSTGKYLINFQMVAEVHGGDTNVEILLNVTIDNSNYSTAHYGLTGNGGSSDQVRSTVAGSHIFDVTNISNCKFKFTTSGLQSTTKILGGTSVGISGFWVIRLGDT